MTQHTYSRLSSLAVVSAISGIAASFGLLAPQLAGFAVVGVVTGIVAIRLIRKYDLSGAGLAVLGLVTSVLFGAATPVWHITQFSSESIPGYTRLDFASLTKPAPQSPDRLNPFSESAQRSTFAGGLPARQSLDQFVGEKICLKGYALSQRSYPKMRQLILSPDGDYRNEKTAVIVEISSSRTWEWGEALAVSGELVANPAAKTGADVPKFLLRNSTIRPIRSTRGLAYRRGTC